MNKKISLNQVLQQKSHQRAKHPRSHSCKIFRTIPRINQGETQTNRPEDKKVDDNDAEIGLHPRDDIDCKC